MLGPIGWPGRLGIALKRQLAQGLERSSRIGTAMAQNFVE
jgi:hypothetical protein